MKAVDHITAKGVRTQILKYFISSDMYIIRPFDFAQNSIFMWCLLTCRKLQAICTHKIQITVKIIINILLIKLKLNYLKKYFRYTNGYKIIPISIGFDRMVYKKDCFIFAVCSVLGNSRIKTLNSIHYLQDQGVHNLTVVPRLEIVFFLNYVEIVEFT